MESKQAYVNRLLVLSGRRMELITEHALRPMSLYDRWPEYESVVTEAIQAFPNDADLHFHLGWGYQFYCGNEQLRFERAEDGYTRAIELRSRETTYEAAALAFLYWEYGRNEEAIAAWHTRTTGWGQEIPVPYWWKIDFPTMFDDFKEPLETATAYFQYGVDLLDTTTPISGFSYLLKANNFLQHIRNYPESAALIPIVYIRLLQAYEEVLRDAVRESSTADVLTRLAQTWGKHLEEQIGIVAAYTQLLNLGEDALRKASFDPAQFHRAERIAKRNVELYKLQLDFVKNERDLSLFATLLQIAENDEQIRGEASDLRAGPLAVILECRPTSSQKIDTVDLIQRSRSLGIWDRSDKHSVDLILQAGITLMKQGAYQRAGEWFQNAHQIAPTNTTVIRYLAMTKWYTQELDEAERLLRTITPLTPEDEISLGLLDAQRATAAKHHQTLDRVMQQTIERENSHKKERAKVHDRCKDDFAAVWDAFDPQLQDLIVETEFRYVAAVSSHSFHVGDYGELCEKALKFLLIDKFFEYAKEENVPIPKKQQATSLRDIGKHLKEATEPNSPLAKFIAQYELNAHFWCRVCPQMIEEIREPRNKAKHEHRADLSRTDVYQARAILYTRGILAEIGIALQKINDYRQKRQRGDDNPFQAD